MQSTGVLCRGSTAAADKRQHTHRARLLKGPDGSPGVSHFTSSEKGKPVTAGSFHSRPGTQMERVLLSLNSLPPFHSE